MEFYGYKTAKNKPKAFHEILDVLEYMINNNMIQVKQDLDSVGYDTGIEIKIIPENFDATDKFSKITSSQLDFIMMSESRKRNKHKLRRVFTTLLLWFPFITVITTFEIFINFLLNNPNNQIETVLSVGDIFLILTLPQVG